VPEHFVANSKVCTVCGGDIEVQIFKGQGVCCENCRAIRDGDFKKSGRN
jgi:predicted nucleic acid-binding Zn ribbon protein